MHTPAQTLFRHTAALLLTVVALAACAPYVPAPYPPAPPAALLDMLLADYRALDLPLPPPDAPLVRVEFPTGGRPIYYLGFELPSAAAVPPDVLVGTERFTADGYPFKVVRVQPAAEPAEGLRRHLHLSTIATPYETNAALATAIQARARGWEALAERLLDLASKTEAERAGNMFFQPKDAPPRQALAMLARAHYANQLSKPDSDWSVIASRFEASLAIGGDARGIDFGPFLQSLRKAIAPRRAAPESIEGRIDALGDMPALASRGKHDFDPAFTHLADLGFAAVPALIEHLHDDRLTRTVTEGFHNFPTYHQRLNMIVSDLLRGIAADDLGTDWLRRQLGCTVDPAMARAWWIKAQATGEEAYVVAHPWSDVTVRLLRRKYPHRLEGVYRGALLRADSDTQRIATAIAASALPVGERRRLLIMGAEHPVVAHRFAALRALRELDAEAYASLLTRALDALPSTPAAPYWESPEGKASQLAAETRDPRVWAALLRAARRADVGLRMELIGKLDCCGPRLPETLAFLAAFLDDDAVPDVTKDRDKWEGPRATFMFPSIAVRDLAAKTIAWLLRLPTDPKQSWTRAEWEALGIEVRRALAAEPAQPSQPAQK